MLRALAAGRKHARVVRDKFVGHLAQQVSVQRTAQAFVRGHEDQGPLVAAAAFHERMIKVAGMGHHLGQHAVHQVRIRTPGESGLLRLGHLGLRHLLHRLGDLRGVLDGLNTPPDVACAGHRLILRLKLVEGRL